MEQAQTQPGRHLSLFSWGLIAVLWLVIAYNLLSLYQEREDNVRGQLAQLALALQAGTAQSVQSAGATLDSLAASIAHLLADESDGLPAVKELLLERGRHASGIREIIYADPQGISIASSHTETVAGPSLADRDFILAHLPSPSSQFIGAAMPPAGPPTSLPLSRPVIDQNGQAAGFIVGFLDLAQFETLFSRFRLAPGASISLLQDDGRLIAGSHPANAEAETISAQPLADLLRRAGEGSLDASEPSTGSRYMLHYQRVEKTPLVIVVSYARHDLLTSLYKDALIHFGSALAVTIIILLGLGSVRTAQRRADLASLDLQASEERYHGLYDSMSDGVVLRTPDGKLIDCNKAFCNMIGYPREELLGRYSHEFTVGDDDEPAALADIEQRGYCDEFDKQYRHRDGRTIYTAIRAWKLDGRGDNIKLYWGVVRDITAHRQTQEQLELSRKIIRHTSEAMLVTDPDERILTVNPAFERITGYSAGEVIGKTPRVLSSGRHSKEFYQAMWAAITGQGHWEGEVWDRRKNGDIYPKYLSINAIRDDEDSPVSHYVAVFIDISERKAQEARIEFLAHHDPLTGLPNRGALELYLDGALATARRNGTGLAVMFIDLDNFKTINDSLGHHAGDQLLCEVAHRLQSTCRESDRVARLGGDEFVIVFEGVKRSEDIGSLALKLIQAVNQPYAVDEHELHTTPSIGISLYPSDGTDVETLMRNADTAMYYAKSNGRNNFQFFAEPMNLAANQRLHLESELWRALAEEQLLLHYQPQVDLLSNRIVGVEALIRWNHPKRGMIPPADFIPVAEETGLILPIGHWVLRTACTQAKAWLDEGSDMGDMAVNISAHQFRQPEFAESVAQILAETGLPPEKLELEITESAVMNSADTSVHTLSELKKMGVKLAIDDFGTGYSSLSYLRRFPIDRLKIDRTFVADMENDPDAASLVSSIIALGHSLGLRLVAEGVENSAQAELLRDKECERVQGFHFYRPVEAGKLPTTPGLLTGHSDS